MEFRLNGPTVYLAPVTVADAAEIIRLRTAPRCEGFLMPTSPDVARQEQWIAASRERQLAGTERYMKICRQQDDHVAGAIRMHEITCSDFHLGSWVTEPGAAPQSAVESFLLALDYMFYDHGALRCHLEVQRGNQGSLRFHPRLGAIITAEDDQAIHFRYTRGAYTAARPRYARIMPLPRTAAPPGP